MTAALARILFRVFLTPDMLIGWLGLLYVAATLAPAAVTGRLARTRPAPMRPADATGRQDGPHVVAVSAPLGSHHAQAPHVPSGTAALEEHLRPPGHGSGRVTRPAPGLAVQAGLSKPVPALAAARPAPVAVRVHPRDRLAAPAAFGEGTPLAVDAKERDDLGDRLI